MGLLGLRSLSSVSVAVSPRLIGAPPNRHYHQFLLPLRNTWRPGAGAIVVIAAKEMFYPLGKLLRELLRRGSAKAL
jgi:hypothetical protein